MIGIVTAFEALIKRERPLAVLRRVNLRVIFGIVVEHFLGFTLKGYVCKLFVIVGCGIKRFLYKLAADAQGKGTGI